MRPSRTRVTAAAALAAVACALALVAPAAAEAYGGPVSAPATPPYNVVTMESTTPSDAFPYWGALTLGAPTGTVWGNGTASALRVTGQNPSGGVGATFWIDAPTGVDLAVGDYQTAAAPDATHASLSDSLCPTSSGAGTLDVQEIAVDGSGDVTAFSASYSMDCAGTQVIGDLRLNGTIPYAVANADFVDFDAVSETVPTTPHAITVSSAGPIPTQITGPATLTGSGASSVTILSDGCNGVTLSGTETCTISVRADAQAIGDLFAGLVLPDNSTAGHVTAQLHMDGYPPYAGQFKPIAPQRILDTRIGRGAPKAAVAAGGVIHLKVTGGQIPTSGVSAVVLNLTETGSTGGGYVTAFPSGTTRPNASNINYVRGLTRANLVTVAVGAGGKVDLYNCCGHVSLIADISGYYLAAGDPTDQPGGSVLRLTVPQRILDTRTWKPAGLKSGWQDDLVVDYGAAIDQGMTAAMVTVTAVRPTGGGYVSAFDPDRDPRTTSTLNLHPGVTTPNLAVVPTTICESGPCAGLPIISVYNGSPKATNILVDIVGVFSSTGGQYGLRYHAVTPTRIADTRYHRGASPLAAHSTTVIQTPPAVAGYWTGAVVANVTAIQPTASTYLTLWSNDGRVKPSISSSNPSALTTVANSTMTEIADDSTFDIYNSSGTTNVAIDVAGTFEFLPSDFPALSPQASGGVHAPLPRLLKAVGATPSAGRPHPAKR